MIFEKHAGDYNDKKNGRHSTQGMIEDQYEPASEKRVLKNLFGI